MRVSLLIKHKIWIGFGILLVILAVITTMALLTFGTTQTTVSSLIEDEQPSVLAAHRFNGYLGQASAALANYLLTKSDQQRQNYQNAMDLASQELDQLKQLNQETQEEEIIATLKLLEDELIRFRGYETTMLELVQDDLKNQPALAYASDHVNALAIEILAALSGMVVSESEEELAEERREWVELIHETRYQFQGVVAAVRIFLSQPSEAALANLRSSVDVIDGLVNKFSAYEDAYTFEQEELVPILLDAKREYVSHMDQMIALNQSERRRMDVFLLDQEVLPLLSGLQGAIDDLVERQSGKMRTEGLQLLGAVDTRLTVLGVLALAGLILGVGVAWIIARMVTLPLNQTVQAIQDVAEGEGDLTRRIELRTKDELGSLADAFNRFSAKLQALMTEVSDSCGQLIAAADQLSNTTASTQSDVRDQGSKIEQISSVIDSMATKVQSVASHTAEAASLAEQTNRNAQEGRDIVDQSVQSSRHLANDVDQAAQVINALETDVESIRGVLGVIRGIAEQTNLLALNAAIEAARAGEQGRGFAVVADEVRTLASRTQDSTAEIQSMIERLQAGSGQAVQVMNSGKDRAQQGLQHAQQAGESLQNISAAVEGMLGMNREIASATEVQGQAANEVSIKVTEINTLAGQTVSSSDTMAATSQQVNQLATQLKSLIGQFKV